MSERQSVNITRWPGKPTSGRFVYRGAFGWYWQCDLHDDDPVPGDQYGELLTWQAAVDGAVAHATVCPFVAQSILDRHHVVT